MGESHLQSIAIGLLSEAGIYVLVMVAVKNTVAVDGRVSIRMLLCPGVHYLAVNCLSIYFSKVKVLTLSLKSYAFLLTTYLLEFEIEKCVEFLSS